MAQTTQTLVMRVPSLSHVTLFFQTNGILYSMPLCLPDSAYVWLTKTKILLTWQIAQKLTLTCTVWITERSALTRSFRISSVRACVCLSHAFIDCHEIWKKTYLVHRSRCMCNNFCSPHVSTWRPFYGSFSVKINCLDRCS